MRCNTLKTFSLLTTCTKTAFTVCVVRRGYNRVRPSCIRRALAYTWERSALPNPSGYIHRTTSPMTLGESERKGSSRIESCVLQKFPFRARQNYLEQPHRMKWWSDHEFEHVSGGTSRIKPLLCRTYCLYTFQHRRKPPAERVYAAVGKQSFHHHGRVQIASFERSPIDLFGQCRKCRLQIIVCGRGTKFYRTTATFLRWKEFCQRRTPHQL